MAAIDRSIVLREYRCCLNARVPEFGVDGSGVEGVVDSCILDGPAVDGLITALFLTVEDIKSCWPVLFRRSFFGFIVSYMIVGGRDIVGSGVGSGSIEPAVADLSIVREAMEVSSILDMRLINDLKVTSDDGNCLDSFERVSWAWPCRYRLRTDR